MPRRVRKRPPLAGRALAGGFGPRPGGCHRGAVAKAMAFANGGGGGRNAARPSDPNPGGTRKRDPLFPRPCGTPHSGPVPPAKRKASAGPGGCGAPAFGGACAGRGVWPRPGGCRRGAVAKAMAFAYGAGWVAKSLTFRRAGRDPETRPAFPRLRGTPHIGPVPSAQREASAGPGGGEAPAFGGACAGRGLWPPARWVSPWRVAKAMAFAKGAGAGPVGVGFGGVAWCVQARTLRGGMPQAGARDAGHVAGPYISRKSRAIIAAWVRFLAPSLRPRVLTCSLTVTSCRSWSRAISLFDFPSQMPRSTSASRRDS